MPDMASGRSRPIGYFVHHQGRGHAERCQALVAALPPERPIRIFCARDDIFGALPENASISRIPSLFEARGDEAAGLGGVPTPATLHCAPLGWPAIRMAMAELVSWFASADPALMICDVSAEIGQLCRICSVPHIAVVQHGDRSDLGHQATYDAAVGLLAPFSTLLAQPEWGPERNARTFFAGGLGLSTPIPEQEVARGLLAIGQDEEVVLVLSGGGGAGIAQAPLGVGARAHPRARWITIGGIERDWHATEPGNLTHLGWVGNPLDHIAAANLIVSSTGNTTCQQILAAGKPWIAVPEWRYFDEQVFKARALARAGMAHVEPHLPSSAHSWQRAIASAYGGHDAAVQQAAIGTMPAQEAAGWIEGLIARLWRHDDTILYRGTIA